MGRTPKKSTAEEKSAKKSGTKKKMGRPRKEIDEVLFKKLCGLQCTLEEIAGVFDCSPDTIERWCKRTFRKTFADLYKIHSAKGKMSLRRYQFDLAKKSAVMAIWLGKQYLGQTEKQEVQVTRADDDSIKEMEAYFNERKQKTDI
jgi:AraC-like DNA-binding protein